MMNKAQTQELFEHEAILFGAVNGIPIKRTVEILGQEAVDFAHRMESYDKDRYFGGYGNGHYTAFYITLQGFYIAVTYNNVTALENAEKGE